MPLLLIRATRLTALPQHALKSYTTRDFTSSSPVASSSKNIFPFPSNPNATPHQIFHLPSNANQDAIKSRYYELVKLHHPDATNSTSTTSQTAHDRFQRIQHAYAILRQPSTAAQTARRYAYQYTPEEVAGRRWTGARNEWGGFEYEFDHNFNEKGNGEGKAKGKEKPAPGAYEKVFHQDDLVYWIFGVVAVVCGIAQFVYFSPAAEASRSHRTALMAIDDARKGREEHGANRRAELKRFVQERKSISAEDQPEVD